MNYNEAVQKKITGEATESDRRKELWEKILNAYEQSGEDAIKSVLIKRSDTITQEFDKLLKQLGKKL